MPARKEIGDWGEAIAVRHLEDKGYVVVARKIGRAHV